MLARMTRGMLLVAAVAFSMQLAGCAPNPEERYGEALEESAPALYAAHSIRDLVTKGHEACNSLATDSLAELLDGQTTGTSDGVQDWARISLAAVDSLCTEHRTQLEEWMMEHK